MAPGRLYEERIDNTKVLILLAYSCFPQFIRGIRRGEATLSLCVRGDGRGCKYPERNFMRKGEDPDAKITFALIQSLVQTGKRGERRLITHVSVTGTEGNAAAFHVLLL